MIEPANLQIVNVVSLQTQQEPVPRTSPGNDNSEKPLLKLVKILLDLGENDTTNMCLTNAQLLDILQKEFHINISLSHSLELEIYINVLKKFLKTWPKWDAVETSVQNAKKDQTIDIEAKLYNEYLSLKEYLQTRLDKSKDGAKQAIAKGAQLKKVHLNISCTQETLYRLLLQKPDANNSIFNNTTPEIPEKILPKPIYLTEILNWPNTIVSIQLNFLKYEYKNLCELKHTLINKKLMKSNRPEEICKKVLFREKIMSKKKDQEKQYLHKLRRCIQSLRLTKIKSEEDTLKLHLLNIMVEDLSKVNIVSKTKLYKYYPHEYSYVRYFQNPVETVGKEAEKYDIVLQELFSIAVCFSIEPCDVDASKNWLKIICKACNISFDVLSNPVKVKQHFSERHRMEIDSQLTCVNCNVTAPMQPLAAQRWKHKCFEKVPSVVYYNV